MEIKNLPEKLSDEKQLELFELYKNNNDIDARNKIVEHNLRLVLAVIRRQFCSYTEKFDEDDLFQVGVGGLVRGVENFDPAKDFKLSTFVFPYIYGHIRRFVDRYDMKMPKAFVSSLDGQPVGESDDGEETFLEDYIASDEDVAGEAVEKEAAKDQIRIIKEWLKKHVSERNCMLFQYRYGLIDGREKSLEEVAQVFGITRERVRQLCDKMKRCLKFALLDHKYARRKWDGSIEREIY